MSDDPRLTRRAVLLAGVAIPIAACRDHPARHATGPLAETDRSALLAAADAEERLIAALANLEAPTGQTAEQGVHADHLIALRKQLGRSTPTPMTSTPPEATQLSEQQFEAALRASVRTLQAAALAAVDGTTAALLASIAASHTAPRASSGAAFFGATP